VPCAAVARPDSAFAARWDNDQTENWRPFGRYTGSYYPFMGCLEDFDTGPVNGTWTFSITNDPSSNPGAVTYIRLVFCDSRGVTCCFTEPGNWRNAPITACEGDAALNIQPSLSFPFGEAEPGEYGFAYLLGRGGVYQEIVPTPDLRNQPPGTYQVCGFSYRRTELDAFPAPDGQLTIAALRANLNGLTPVACAELSPTCLPVTIVAPPDTTRLDERICRGDSIVMGGVAFRETGFYTTTLPGIRQLRQRHHPQLGGHRRTRHQPHGDPLPQRKHHRRHQYLRGHGHLSRYVVHCRVGVRQYCGAEPHRPATTADHPVARHLPRRGLYGGR
jgi:hypothetical protein